MVDRGKSFQVVANLIMVLLVLFCLVPFVLLIVSSITQENSLVRNGYSFIPEKIDFSAYKLCVGTSCRQSSLWWALY